MNFKDIESKMKIYIHYQFSLSIYATFETFYSKYKMANTRPIDKTECSRCNKNIKLYGIKLRANLNNDIIDLKLHHSCLDEIVLCGFKDYDNLSSINGFSITSVPI